MVDEVALQRGILPVGYFGFTLSAITTPVLHIICQHWLDSRSISAHGIERLNFQSVQELNQNRLNETWDAAKAGPFIFSPHRSTASGYIRIGAESIDAGRGSRFAPCEWNSIRLDWYRFSYMYKQPMKGWYCSMIISNWRPQCALLKPHISQDSRHLFPRILREALSSI